MSQPKSQPKPIPEQDPVSEPTLKPEDKGRMLPGVAAILLFLLLLTLANVYEALNNIFGQGKYGVLAVCTILLAGLSGLVRMRRWGWSIVIAGCAVLAGGYAYFFSVTHALPAAIQGAFMLVFFLYLVRHEVRDRML